MLNPELFLESTDLSDPHIYDDGDRGPAEFFHGRVDIRTRFQSVLANARGTNKGTTFLIQGAPGAGKSALLHQMREESEGWKVAHIGSQELWSPVAMAQALGESYTISRSRAAEIGVKFFGAGAVKEVAGHATPTQILRHLVPPAGLILMLDEAQKLRKLLPQNIETATATLDAVHNGDIQKPVLLLTAGLGITKSVYKTLDVSRFRDGCVHNIGALDSQAERAVIRDWLTVAGGAKGEVGGVD